MELNRTTNYQNIAFKDELTKQIQGGIGLTDATWVLEFVRNNFTPDDIFTVDELVTSIQSVTSKFSAACAFHTEDDLLSYVKDMYIPEYVFGRDRVISAAEDLKGK